MACCDVQVCLIKKNVFFKLAVQIPPSTTYAPPMKRPIEEEEGGDDKSPNKKKKKLQKKCNYYLFITIFIRAIELCSHYHFTSKSLYWSLLPFYYSSRWEIRASSGHECSNASEPTQAWTPV